MIIEGYLVDGFAVRYIDVLTWIGVITMKF